MRIAAGIEYDGLGFCGWQFQHRVRTVQRCVEKALSSIANHEVKVICAGRTDTGVHAVEQIVHFETCADRSMRSWVLGPNANLPDDVSVSWAQVVSDSFHARFSARSRRYRYVILNQWPRPSILKGKVTWVYCPLDVKIMHEAAQALAGEQDFSTFRGAACQANSPLRTIHQISVTRQGHCIYIDIHANAFLLHMVRNIAGVLIAIGSGEKPLSWVSEILALRDRTKGGVTAPPEGLYLVKVHYDPEMVEPTDTRFPVFW